MNTRNVLSFSMKLINMLKSNWRSYLDSSGFLVLQIMAGLMHTLVSSMHSQSGQLFLMRGFGSTGVWFSKVWQCHNWVEWKQIEIHPFEVTSKFDWIELSYRFVFYCNKKKVGLYIFKRHEYQVCMYVWI